MSATFARSRGDECLSDLTLDLIAAGESPSTSAGEHLKNCERCASRLDEIQRDKLAFAKDAPPLKLETSSSKSSNLRLVVGSVASLAAALAIVLVSTVDDKQTDVVRAKGGGQIENPKVEHPVQSFSFFVQHDGEVRSGSDGEKVFPQDALRFAYTSDEPVYVYVLSIDPESSISVYYASKDEPEPGGRGRALPQSTRLDDTIGAEKLIGLLCSAKQEADALKASLESSPKRKLSPQGCTVVELQLEKVKP